jgi:hypothetical protein
MDETKVGEGVVLPEETTEEVVSPEAGEDVVSQEEVPGEEIPKPLEIHCD